jgi:hypothetical protein
MAAMMNTSYSTESPSGEIDDMAAVLEARHGCHAADVATFLADLMRGQGDEEKAETWLAVGRRVEWRTLVRMRAD